MPEPVLGPDSMVKPDVPKGVLTTFTWDQSKIFPDTKRQVSVYTPANHDPKKETAVMVFQDGHSYLNLTGEFRVTTVLDNLIHAKEIPPLIAIFIDPGHKGDTKPESPWRNNNRSFEYDTLSPDYAQFLLEEILPEVSKTLRLKLTTDPEQRAICGASSGGICAWTVAWQRPDAFRKVVSSIGSFTNIRGGDAYPGMIRKTENKPIRAFFQEGINDLDNQHGSWPLGNMQMQAALKFKNYDHQFVWGHGTHNGKHAGAIFPDALRWLWRE
ncbi:esterase family protein [Phragmitibacter flavus]|uniref:Esterase family protein n=2 Tax=Phragmitibacter flavus TaxID=2576071 RepID=A0A5R8KG56_9BACT|nr:esterase family protein [Phragmitibacter flavus]